MSKKIFCLALALMMLVCSTAFAASSKTNGSVSSGYVGSTGDFEDDFVLAADPTKDAIAQAALKTLMDAIAANGGAVAKAFGADAEAALSALEGVDVATLDIETVFPLILANYKASIGDVEVAFDTTIADDVNVVAAAFGLVNGEDITWSILKAELAADGKINVVFTQEVLTPVPEGSDLVLAVLSAK